MKALNVDFEDEFENMVDPATAQALAQAGTQLVGGAIARRQQKQLNKTELYTLIETTCGKKPVIKKKFGIFGGKTKATNQFETCRDKVTSEQTALQQQALNIQQQELANRSASASSEDEGLSTRAKIGIGVGALAVIGVVVYLIVKK
jgi:hypothetical protein